MIFNRRNGLWFSNDVSVLVTIAYLRVEGKIVRQTS